MQQAYYHRDTSGGNYALPVGKVVCVGRNYAEHARELNNPVPEKPLLFLKPASSLVALEQPISLPAGRGPVHHEVEIALLIGPSDHPYATAFGPVSVVGVGLALDLTLRKLQGELKKAGHPWDIAKGFAGACPCSRFVPPRSVGNVDSLTFTLEVNGALRQRGNSADMLFPLDQLLATMDYYFGLQTGDVVLTGTPAGVSSLQPRDQLVMKLNGQLAVSTEVYS